MGWKPGYYKKEDKRRKEARLARKLEMESLWLTRRKEEDAQEVVEASKESFMMEWEEHDLEYNMASLGLEEEDLVNEEEIGEEEQDLLDTWIISLDAGCISPGASMESASPGTSMEWLVEDEGVGTGLLEEKDCEDDYMTWLVEELRGMRVEDDVIEIVSECVWTISCPGGCQDYVY